MSTINLRKHNMFSNIGNDIKAIHGDLSINKVNKQRCNNIKNFEAFNQMVFICSYEG
jgi:hypothetical protein